MARSVERRQGDANGDNHERKPLLEKDDDPDDSIESSQSWWREVSPYSTYVLVCLLLAYLFNQLDRYMLAITVKPLAQDIHFGDKGCVINDSVEAFGETIKCTGNQTHCLTIVNKNDTAACKWDYNGQGWDYQILAGPVFILIYTLAGVFIGFAADHYNRKMMLAGCLIFWSTMTLLTGLVTEYWHLVILRFGLGLGEAGCTPFAASLVADYFSANLRGTAMGIYNFGIYMGYSLSYAIGNFITEADINGQGWRWSFILPGIPGIALGILIALTVREPLRKQSKPAEQSPNESKESNSGPLDGGEDPNNGAANSQSKPTGVKANDRLPLKVRFMTIAKAFMSPSLLLLCLAGSIRNAGGYVWAYNTEPYFEAIHTTKTTIGEYMSWIPLVGGSLGVLFGGFISDRIVKRRGLYARIFVLVGSQFLAAPFAAGALFLDVPWAFISLLPANIIGEMWVGVTLAVGVELVPPQVRTSAVAVYLFIITNVGGNFPLLVTPIQNSLEADGFSKAAALRGTLYILYPGMFVLGGILYLLPLCLLRRDQKRAQKAAITLEYKQP